MSRRDIGASGVDTFAVNAALLLLAVVALAPLAWMLSVSFMPRGEASHFQPPLLPSHFSLDNYRETCSSASVSVAANSALVVARPPRCRCW